MAERVVVIGGGAAGLMAAGRAAECAVPVLMLEKTDRLGQKLRLTGGGHGNITHTGDLRSFLAHLAPNGEWMRPALRRFSSYDLVSLFAKRGLAAVAEADGRVFPASRNAHDVVTTLRAWCVENGVQFRFDSPAQEIRVHQGAVCGVSVGGKAVSASSIVLATGGMSYPQTGSSGDGYRLAQALGHTVTPLRPGLTPLVVQDPWCHALQGVSLPNVTGWLEQGDRRLARATGDLLFTHFGVSGPLALVLSSHLGDALASGPVQLCLDLAPAHTRQSLEDDLRERAASTGRMNAGAALRYVAPQRQAPPSSEPRVLMPRALSDAILAQCGVAPDLPMSQLSAAARRQLAAWLKRCAMTVAHTLPMEQATITLGGVSWSEVDPQTMGSRLVDGLFLAGEILDVSGDSGGYNLQIAFSSGYLAGESAALYTRHRRE